MSALGATAHVALIFLRKLTWGNDDRDLGHHDNIWGNLWLSVLGAYYKGCQSEVYGEREQLNPPDDKGCIYGLGSLGAALYAPSTLSSQVKVFTQTYKRLTLSREILWKSALLGCKVPADMRMIEMLSDQLRVDQAILTESFCLMVHVQGRDLTSGSLLRGCMHLVDLAVSERLDKTEGVGDRLKEAQHINRSLSALGDVISSLAQKQSHVPYRNSKLTQLLQDSLGKAKTLMFVHISPEPDALGEIISTLKFVERVSTIELGAAKANKEGSDVNELKEQIATLKAALARKEGGESAAVHFSRYSSPNRQGIKSSGSSPSHSSTAVFCILLVFESYSI
ncbi:hypothetical protein OROMI_020991 [Orobanche minor]